MIFLITKFSNFEIFFEKNNNNNNNNNNKKKKKKNNKKKKKNNNKSVGRISWFLTCLKKKTKTIRLVRGLKHGLTGDTQTV